MHYTWVFTVVVSIQISGTCVVACSQALIRSRMLRENGRFIPKHVSSLFNSSSVSATQNKRNCSRQNKKASALVETLKFVTRDLASKAKELRTAAVAVHRRTGGGGQQVKGWVPVSLQCCSGGGGKAKVWSLLKHRQILLRAFFIGEVKGKMLHRGEAERVVQRRSLWPFVLLVLPDEERLL